LAAVDRPGSPSAPLRGFDRVYKLFQRPKPVRNAGRHGRGDAQRLVRADKIVIREMDDHADLAEALGVSAPLIRQARLNSAAAAHRSPPEGWERAVIRLATARAERLSALAERLGKGV